MNTKIIGWLLVAGLVSVPQTLVSTDYSQFLATNQSFFVDLRVALLVWQPDNRYFVRDTNAGTAVP